MTINQDAAAAARKTANLAHEGARRIVHSMVRETGGRMVSRPAFRGRPDLDMTVTDAEPMAGLQAATSVMHAARRLSVDYLRQAREDGHTWQQIGGALGVGDRAEAGDSVASAAYDFATDGSASGRLAWTCPACHHTVIDHGPEAGHPADVESGHADGCQRLTATITAWEASWEGGAE